jgi:hypothetical protein
MNMSMNHTPEFSNADQRKHAEAQRAALADAVSKAYARLFCTEDGKLVLEDLRRKFGHARPRFDLREREHSTVTAALIDGQCSVLREIEQACRTGGFPLAS